MSKTDYIFRFIIQQDVGEESREIFYSRHMQMRTANKQANPSNRRVSLFI